jgi:hypothetical protein
VGGQSLLHFGNEGAAGQVQVFQRLDAARLPLHFVNGGGKPMLPPHPTSCPARQPSPGGSLTLGGGETHQETAYTPSEAIAQW